MSTTGTRFGYDRLDGGERSSADKDDEGGEVSGEICAWNSESSFRETFLHLCRVQ